MVTPNEPLPATASARVLAFGEVLWDNLPGGMVLGGAAANFAGRVQSLGEPVTLVSRIGQDGLGDDTLVQLARMGLSTAHIQRDQAYPTGIVQVDVDESGSASSYTIVPNVAYDFIDFGASMQRAAQQAHLVYFGTLAQRNPVGRATLHKLLEAAPQATKLLDVNLRAGCYLPQTVKDSLDAADILKLNDVEVNEIGGMLGLKNPGMDAFCDAVIRRHGVKLCLVTRGAEGVYARSDTGASYQIPGFDVEVIDTVGAGDAFTAGFVWSFIRGGSVEDSCEIGNRLGAMVATQRGGTMPVTVAQLLAFGKLERSPVA